MILNINILNGCWLAEHGVDQVLGPKIAVPILTMVEPSAIAASMSLVVPMDSVSNG